MICTDLSISDDEQFRSCSFYIFQTHVQNINFGLFKFEFESEIAKFRYPAGFFNVVLIIITQSVQKLNLVMLSVSMLSVVPFRGHRHLCYKTFGNDENKLECLSLPASSTLYKARINLNGDSNKHQTGINVACNDKSILSCNWVYMKLTHLSPVQY